MSSNLLVKAIRSEDVAEVKRIIASGSANNSIDYDRPIRWASSAGHADIVKDLLKDPLVDPSRGLRVAVKNGHTDVVKALVKDSRIKKLVDGDLVKLAERNGYDEIAEILSKTMRGSPRTRSPTPLLPPDYDQLSPPLFSSKTRKKRPFVRSRSPSRFPLRHKSTFSSRSSPSSSPTQSPNIEETVDDIKKLKSNEIVNDVKDNGRRIGKGKEGEVYLYRGMACKLFKSSTGDSAKGRNIYFIKDYGDTGVVPKFYYVEKKKWKVLCMEYLDGYKTLKHILKEKPDQKKRQALFDAVMKARKLLPHDIFFNDFRNPGNIMIKYVSNELPTKVGYEDNGSIKVMFIEGGQETEDKHALDTLRIYLKEQMRLD